MLQMLLVEVRKPASPTCSLTSFATPGRAPCSRSKGFTRAMWPAPVAGRALTCCASTARRRQTSEPRPRTVRTRQEIGCEAAIGIPGPGEEQAVREEAEAIAASSGQDVVMVWNLLVDERAVAQQAERSASARPPSRRSTWRDGTGEHPHPPLEEWRKPDFERAVREAQQANGKGGRGCLEQAGTSGAQHQRLSAVPEVAARSPRKAVAIWSERTAGPRVTALRTVPRPSKPPCGRTARGLSLSP
jgi:hypothetical protein